MSSGERPIGTAKGKQPNTEALCQPPPPPVRPLPPPLLIPGEGSGLLRIVWKWVNISGLRPRGARYMRCQRRC